MDTDGDWLADEDEITPYRTDLLVPNATVDTDGDGLPNVEEGDTYSLNTTNLDTDEDR